MLFLSNTLIRQRYLQRSSAVFANGPFKQKRIYGII